MMSSDSYIALTSRNIQTECLDLTNYITIDKTVADTFLKRSKLRKMMLLCLIQENTVEHYC